MAVDQLDMGKFAVYIVGKHLVPYIYGGYLMGKIVPFWRS